MVLKFGYTQFKTNSLTRVLWSNGTCAPPQQAFWLIQNRTDRLPFKSVLAPSQWVYGLTSDPTLQNRGRKVAENGFKI